MRMDKLTTKFQLALADAQSLALGRDHQFIEPVHLMMALLDQEGGTARPLLAQGRSSPASAKTGQRTLNCPAGADQKELECS